MKQLTVHNQATLWLFLPIFFCLAGCQGYESSIPDRTVYLKRNIYIIYSESSSGSLSNSGSSLYVTSSNIATEELGYGGIIVVHAFDDSYYAFDLACPVEVDENIRIGKPDQSLICKCDSCNEEYDLSLGLGTPLNHISKEGLRRYNVTLDGNYIIVTR